MNKNAIKENIRRSDRSTSGSSDNFSNKWQRELSCLYEILRLKHRKDISGDRFLQKVAEILPGGWRYPEIACAEIRYNNKSFHSPGFKPGKWRLTAKFKCEDGKTGSVNVYYLEERPKMFEGPYTLEECDLLNLIAGELKTYIDLKNTEKELQEAELFYRTARSSLSDAVLISKSDGRIIHVSAARDLIMGYPLRDITTGMTVFDLLGDIKFPENARASSNSNENLEREVLDKSGKAHVLLINIKKVKVKGGDYLISLKDISRLREAEQAGFYLSSIIESSYDAIIGFDLDGKIVSWNKGAERIYGYQRNEVIGRSISCLMPDGHADEIKDVIEKIRSCDKIEHYNAIRRTRHGRRFDASITLSPIKNYHGNVVGISAIVRDLTDQKKTEQDLDEVCKRLEAERSALKEILGHIEEDKNILEKQISSNYRRMIKPLLESIGEKMPDEGKHTLHLLDSCLRDLTSPFMNKLDQSYATLSPREMKICNMIRSGMSSKEIARILDISILTVHKFRQQIRKKFGLTNKTANLSTFLKSI